MVTLSSPEPLLECLHLQCLARQLSMFTSYVSFLTSKGGQCLPRHLHITLHIARAAPAVASQGSLLCRRASPHNCCLEQTETCTCHLQARYLLQAMTDHQRESLGLHSTSDLPQWPRHARDLLRDVLEPVQICFPGF